MSSQYKISSSELNSYEFVTDSGVRYTMYFTEYYLPDAKDEDILIRSFGFYCDPPFKPLQKNSRYDEKVKNTIVSFIRKYFEEEGNNGLLYVCNQENGYARHRKVTFNKWFRELSLPVEKHDCKEKHIKLDLYFSLIVREDHPQKKELIDAFYRSLEQYFSDEN